MAPRPALTRLVERPHLSDWHSDELISFIEAAALFFPRGPFSAASLRRVHKEGNLAAVQICGKSFTTIKAMNALVQISTPEVSKINIDEIFADAEEMMVKKMTETLRADVRRRMRPRTI